MATTVLNLEKYKNSFKTVEEFNQFALDFGKVTAGDLGLVILADRLIATLLPPEEAQKRLQEQIVKQLVSDPDLLDTLQKRIESDDLVP
jgi:hypothetical protein